jgi:hypothetical protein
VAIQPDGKIIVVGRTGAVGSNDFAVARLVGNDEQVLATNAGLVVQWGSGAAVIPTFALLTTDIDHAPAELVYTVTGGPSHGTLLVNSIPASQFSQADINVGLVSYAHNESPNFFDNFTFTVDDGIGAAAAGTFDIVIEPYPGDYNRDRKVDAADYVVWRKTLGATGLNSYTGADGDGDGDVDSDDLAVWKAHYGEALPTFEFTPLDVTGGPQPTLDVAALDGAQAEWTGPGIYAQRVDNVAQELIANETVLEDQAVDTLTGGPDRDLFFAAVDTPSNNDVLTDLDSMQEQVKITHPPIPASLLFGEALGAVFTANDSSIDFVRIAFDPVLWNGSTKNAVMVEITLVELLPNDSTIQLQSLSLLLSAAMLVSLDGGPGGTAVVDIDTMTAEMGEGSRVNVCVTLHGPGVLDGLAEEGLETCVVLDPVQPS